MRAESQGGQAKYLETTLPISQENSTEGCCVGVHRTINHRASREHIHHTLYGLGESVRWKCYARQYFYHLLFMALAVPVWMSFFVGFVTTAVVARRWCGRGGMHAIVDRRPWRSKTGYIPRGRKYTEVLLSCVGIKSCESSHQRYLYFKVPTQSVWSRVGSN